MELFNNQDIENRISVLKRVSFFSDTPEENLKEFAYHLTNIHFEANESVFKKGDIGNSMFIITQGLVNVHDGEHVFQLIKGDTIFIFSDGYIDQFGGQDNRKFMSKHFKSTLVQIQNLSMKKQKEKLLEIFIEWKNNTVQIDDVLVIGVKV